MNTHESSRPWCNRRHWTLEDDEWLLDRVSVADRSNRALICEVAKMAGRTERGAIKSRLRKLLVLS